MSDICSVIVTQIAPDVNSFPAVNMTSGQPGRPTTWKLWYVFGPLRVLSPTDLLPDATNWV